MAYNKVVRLLPLSEVNSPEEAHNRGMFLKDDRECHGLSMCLLKKESPIEYHAEYEHENKEPQVILSS